MYATLTPRSLASTPRLAAARSASEAERGDPCLVVTEVVCDRVVQGALDLAGAGRGRSRSRARACPGRSRAGARRGRPSVPRTCSDPAPPGTRASAQACCRTGRARPAPVRDWRPRQCWNLWRSSAGADGGPIVDKQHWHRPLCLVVPGGRCGAGGGPARVVRESGSLGRGLIGPGLAPGSPARSVGTDSGDAQRDRLQVSANGCGRRRWRVTWREGPTSGQGVSILASF
jgi:hypothetical protein